MVLLAFPAANRDPLAFPRPNEVLFDRDTHRHMAFGAGIHRCIGAHLALMLIRVALEEERLRVFTDFRLSSSGKVEWSAGTVRGPLRLPIALVE